MYYQLGVRAEGTWNRGRQLQLSHQYVQLFPTAFLNYKFTEKHSLILSLDKKINWPTYENMNLLFGIAND